MKENKKRKRKHLPMFEVKRKNRNFFIQVEDFEFLFFPVFMMKYEQKY